MNSSFDKPSDLLKNIFSQYESNIVQASNSLSRVWYETVSAIKGPYLQESSRRMDYGSQLADHSRIIDFKNGILYVETDHPARMQLFQTYKSFILKGLQSKIKEIEIKNIYFRLKRNEENKAASLRTATSDEVEKFIEKNESKFIKREEANMELPSELKSIFDRIREDIKND